MKVLEALGVSVERGGRAILRHADLSATPAALLAIAGPNGSGKSTLVRAMTGIWTVSAGEVRLGGVPLPAIARREIARTVSYVPQDARLDFGFTVRETVAMGRHPHRGRFAQEAAADRAAIERALRFCDVAHIAARAVNTLSGGERQRVSIARSLAVEPQFLFLDEPTASLDIEHSLDIFGLCRRLAESGCAVVVCTHDLNAAARFAHRVALMKSGEIVRQGSGEEVLEPAAIESVFGVRAELLRSAAGDRVYFFHPGNQRSE